MKKLLSYFYFKYLFKLRHYLLGRKPLFLLIKEKSADEIVVILTNSIGDDIYGMSYVKCLKERLCKRVTILCLQSRKNLVESYPGSYDAIRTYDKSSKEWKGISSIYKSNRLITCAKKNGVYSILPFYYMPLDYRDGRNQLDFIREIMLDERTPMSIQYPVIKDVKVKTIENFEDNAHKIVVINPYSASMINIDVLLFEKIADALLTRGFDVYTNVIGSQRIIKGTKPLDCNLSEFYSICNRIPLVISTRSGLIDWCITTKTKFYVYYFPFGDNSYMYPDVSIFYERHTLSAWETNNVREHIYKNMDESYKDFIGFLEEYQK